MDRIDQPRQILSRRAVLTGGLSGIGILALVGTVTFLIGYWVLSWMGTPSKNVYAVLSDYRNPWVFAIGGIGSLVAAWYAGAIAARSGSAPRVQALVAGLICVMFDTLTVLYPASTARPYWVYALAIFELLAGSLLGGFLATRNRTFNQGSDAMPEPGRVKRALATIVHGFLLGIGFTLVLGTFLVVAEFLVQRQVEHVSDKMQYPEITREEKAKDLQLLDVEERKSGDRDYIIGTIKNNGAETFRSIGIEANLFQAGKFVDKYSTYNTSPLAPGASAYFKIECGCKGSGPAEHDSFKTEIISAY